MATWNHRVVKKRDPNYTEDWPWPEFFYEIHEAHYNDNGDLCSITENAIVPYGEDMNELKETLSLMIKACSEPALVDGEIEYAPWDDDGDDGDDDTKDET